jgi:hypothetical protein
MLWQWLKTLYDLSAPHATCWSRPVGTTHATCWSRPVGTSPTVGNSLPFWTNLPFHESP